MTASVLVLDDGIVTGNLLPLTAAAVRDRRGEPRTCALIPEGRYEPPDYLAETAGHHSEVRMGSTLSHHDERSCYCARMTLRRAPSGCLVGVVDNQ